MSTAAEHEIFEQHALDFDNVEVIDCERQGLKRRVKEAFHINAEKHSLNKDKGLEPNLVQPLPLANTLCSVSKGITYLVSQLPTLAFVAFLSVVWHVPWRLFFFFNKIAEKERGKERRRRERGRLRVEREGEGERGKN